MKRTIHIFTLVLLGLLALSSRAQIPTNGLVLHLNGNLGVEEAIGDPAEGNDPVVRWLDQSSAGNNVATNGFAGTTTPTYRTNLVNGQSAVEFNLSASTDRLRASTPLISGTTDFSIFAVIRAADVIQAGFIGGNYGFGNGAGLEFYTYQGKLSFYDLGFLQGSTPLSTNTWYLVQAEKSGSTYTL